MAWRYVSENLHGVVPSPWLHLVLVLTSVLCGAIVGGEREKREKPAGLRTLILVCLGSATFTMASFAFVSTTGDSGRVAAQIVTGIGFLGAGAILHSSGMVRGMTTAATIWAVAAVGMVAGIGHAGAALGLSVVVRLVLGAALAFESRSWGRIRESEAEVVFTPDGGRSRVHIEKILEDFHVSAPLEVEAVQGGDAVRATIRFRLSRRHRREFLSEVAALPQVRAIAAREV